MWGYAEYAEAIFDPDPMIKRFPKTLKISRCVEKRVDAQEKMGSRSPDYWKCRSKSDI